MRKIRAAQTAIRSTTVLSSLSSASPGKGFDQVVEDRGPSLQALVVVLVARADPGDQRVDARCFGALEFAVLQIDVVNDFRDRPQPTGVGRQASDKNLECAAIALVRELGIEHVESDLALFRAIAARRNELEFRVGVDEALDKPRASHPIDMNPLASDPDALSIIGQVFDRFLTLDIVCTTYARLAASH